jgi:hypothetical protein
MINGHCLRAVRWKAIEYTTNKTGYLPWSQPQIRNLRVGQNWKYKSKVVTLNHNDILLEGPQIMNLLILT